MSYVIMFHDKQLKGQILKVTQYISVQMQLKWSITSLHSVNFSSLNNGLSPDATNKVWWSLNNTRRKKQQFSLLTI